MYVLLVKWSWTDWRHALTKNSYPLHTVVKHFALTGCTICRIVAIIVGEWRVVGWSETKARSRVGWPDFTSGLVSIVKMATDVRMGGRRILAGTSEVLSTVHKPFGAHIERNQSFAHARGCDVVCMCKSCVLYVNKYSVESVYVCSVFCVRDSYLYT